MYRVVKRECRLNPMLRICNIHIETTYQFSVYNKSFVLKILKIKYFKICILNT